MEKANEEMRVYLEQHKIEDVFVSLTENILTLKPENPIGFMIGELMKRYPDATSGTAVGY